MTPSPEIDLESVLRRYVGENPAAPAGIPAAVYVNSEKRVVLRLPNDGIEYVVFGNNARQFPVPKPPTQVAGVSGFDSFAPMGGKR